MDPFAHIFDELERCRAALDYHLERHNVLTSNVAHVDTPGYIPHDLTRAEGKAFETALEVAMNHPRHMSASTSDTTKSAGHVVEVRTTGTGRDGNQVSLDEQAAKIAENQLRYEMIAQLSSGKSLLYAASDGKE